MKDFYGRERQIQKNKEKIIREGEYLIHQFMIRQREATIADIRKNTKRKLENSTKSQYIHTNI
jgi:hypothetical protein